MDLDHWKQLDSLLQSVLERPPEERDAFLRHACAGDEPLERRVRALLSAEPQAKNFLERPAIDVAAQSLACDQNSNSQPDADALTAVHISSFVATLDKGCTERRISPPVGDPVSRRPEMPVLVAA